MVLIVLAGVVAAKMTVRPLAGKDDQVESGAVCPTPVATSSAAEKTAAAPVEGPASASRKASKPAGGKTFPTMLELGSVGCVPCAHMAPITDALKVELKGKVTVQFYDVGKDSAMADKYHIDVIPTQVFLDASGKELFRHVGVFERQDILAKMKELKMLSS